MHLKITQKQTKHESSDTTCSFPNISLRTIFLLGKSYLQGLKHKPQGSYQLFGNFLEQLVNNAQHLQPFFITIVL